MQGLVNRGLGVKGEASVDFSGNLAGNDVEDLPTEFNEQTVEGRVNLVVDGRALCENDKCE